MDLYLISISKLEFTEITPEVGDSTGLPPFCNIMVSRVDLLRRRDFHNKIIM